MSNLGVVAADVVVPPETVVEDDMATDVVVTAGPDVVLGPFVLIVAGPVLRVLLTEPVDILVDVITVVVREVISSEEFSEDSLEEHFFSHKPFCSKYLESLLGPPK